MLWPSDTFPELLISARSFCLYSCCIPTRGSHYWNVFSVHLVLFPRSVRCFYFLSETSFLSWVVVMFSSFHNTLKCVIFSYFLSFPVFSQHQKTLTFSLWAVVKYVRVKSDAFRECLLCNNSTLMQHFLLLCSVKTRGEPVAVFWPITDLQIVWPPGSDFSQYRFFLKKTNTVSCYKVTINL